jgi:G:T/U-mismatch repair DNA glycosylase
LRKSIFEVGEIATPGTKNLKNLKFAQTYAKVPQNRFWAISDHLGPKSAHVNMVANSKNGRFTKGFGPILLLQKCEKKTWSKITQNIAFFFGPFGHKKWPKMPKRS